ncbi:3-hydroxyacyl-CoA dehydrogenase NAD-binding domain-containing protein [Cupriavidus sp. CP313]
MTNFDKPIHRIAIVGTGVIGASWAAQYLASGFDVIATDPAPNAEANLRKYVDDAWTVLTRIGLSPGASRDRLAFTPDMKQALEKADFVQENGPERLDFKIKLYAEMDAVTPPDSVIASSSSSLTMSAVQSKCEHPERCVIGHPFNPPHVVPLVEVVGGAKTSPAAIERAMTFYKSIGKRAILLRKEVPGHVANRLQSALYREVLYLVEQGVLSVADADDAVSWGPGLRWGVMGPSLQFHLAGGAGGIQHFIDHLMPPVLEALWKELGTPRLTPEFKQSLADEVLQEAAGRSVAQLSEAENEMLVGLLRLRSGRS